MCTGPLAVPKGQLALSLPCPPASNGAEPRSSARPEVPPLDPPAGGWRWQQEDMAERNWWLPSRSNYSSFAPKATAPARQENAHLRLHPGVSCPPLSRAQPRVAQHPWPPLAHPPGDIAQPPAPGAPGHPSQQRQGTGQA